MYKPQQYFVTGIGTDVGKTVVSAVLVRALNADYWKPLQSGDLSNSDSLKIENWCGLISKDRIHQERYKLSEPLSPHASAAIDNIEIDLASFKLPAIQQNLIVEGAGGLAVPLNDKETMLDLIKQLKLPVILVVRNYLGSINHTLLSIAALRQNDISIKAMVVFGERVQSSEEIIEKLSKIPFAFHVSNANQIDADFILSESLRLKDSILSL